MDLPFKLKERHKYYTLRNWKRRGLIHDDLDSLYNEYIYVTSCDLCGIEFKSALDRKMEHSHETGEFRNFVCHSCNMRKSDVKMKSNNTSGCKCIFKHKSKTSKQGFIWEFKLFNTTIKTSTDFDKLVQFAEQWKKENNYHT